MGASSASGYSNNFIWVGEAQFALKSVVGAFWGCIDFLSKNQFKQVRPGREYLVPRSSGAGCARSPLEYEIGLRFKSAGVLAGAEVEEKWERKYLLA